MARLTTVHYSGISGVSLSRGAFDSGSAGFWSEHCQPILNVPSKHVASVSSPQKVCIDIIKTNVYRINVALKYFIEF